MDIEAVHSASWGRTCSRQTPANWRAAAALVVLLAATGGAQTMDQAERGDPSIACQRWPERPECGPGSEKQGTELQTHVRANVRKKRPTPLPPSQPTPEPGGCTTADAAASGLGSTKEPSEICPCQKAQGTVKSYLRNPADGSDQRLAIEVCDTGADYSLDGVIVIPKDASQPAFAQSALDDLSVIASISDPSRHVGFELLIDLLDTVSTSPRLVGDRKVYIRWGGAPSKSKRGKSSPFTRPGTSGGLPADAKWQAATSQGLDVYGSDGIPVGGKIQYFKGLLKGTGNGVGSSVFYQPEILSNETSCPSALAPNVALLHELEHAAHMALGQVDNTPYSNTWWNQDPLAALYGVHEEKFIVDCENEYRTALKQTYPSRYPNLRPRRSYLGDC